MHKSFTSYVFAIGVSLAPMHSKAQETEGALAPLIITATRNEASIGDTPYAIVVREQADIQRNAFRTLPQVFREVPGAMVQETSPGQGSPYVRGFTGFRNLMLLDGVRLNNSVFRSGPNQYWSTIDVLAVDHIEIVKGPKSALYGSDAIGGTAQVFTKDPFAGAEEGRGYFLSRISTARQSAVGRIEAANLIGTNSAFATGLSGKRFGDLEGGRDIGWQTGVGYDEYDGDFKFAHRLGGSATLTLLHQRVRQNNVPRTHKTIHAKSWKGTSLGKDIRRELDQERNLSYLRLDAKDWGTLADEARVILSWHEQKEVRDRIKSNGSNQLQGFEVSTLGTTIQMAKGDNEKRWTYGMEYYHDEVDSFSSEKDSIQGPVANDASYDLLDLFAQRETTLFEDFHLIAGTRFSHAAVDAKSVQDPINGLKTSLEDDWNALVGSLRLTVPMETTTWFAGLSQGFRAPNLSDLTRLDSARTDEIETPSPNLQPERFLTSELGFRKAGNGDSIEITLFHTWIDDLITRSPTGVTIGGENEVTKRNSGDGWVAGAEMIGEITITDSWSLYGHLAWLQGEAYVYPTSNLSDRRSEYLDRLMPLMGEVGLAYKQGGGPWWGELSCRFAADADKLSTRDIADSSRIPDGGTPSYTVLDLQAGRTFAQATEVTVLVENLLNEDYRVHGSGTNEAGRNFILSVRSSF
jgi:hemoglobin/transferrin/lactoferrin receptor protein